MTHKEECICYCIDHLNSRNLSHTFNRPLFDHYYRKNEGSLGNAYLVGVNAADVMITNYNPKTMEAPNESEAA